MLGVFRYGWPAQDRWSQRSWSAMMKSTFMLAALDEALQKLTAHAAALGTQLVSDVQADRRRRGATRR
jgi:hypothetical protein